MTDTPRIVSWFSCGAASAVATKLALTKWREGETTHAGREEFVIAYCEIREEHPDNARFLKDCERWFDHPVTVLGNDKYSRSAHEVFRKTRFLVGPTGARCTGELKKTVRFDFQKPNDLLVFGYTIEEKHRAERLMRSEIGIDFWPVLEEHHLTKGDCLAILKRAQIGLPHMYKLGYRNNNCIGCVKGQAGYWNKIRVDFPEVFEEMAKIEEETGRTICKREWTESGKRHLERISLRDLPPDLGIYKAESDIECGIFCASAADSMALGVVGEKD